MLSSIFLLWIFEIVLERLLGVHYVAEQHLSSFNRLDLLTDIDVIGYIVIMVLMVATVHLLILDLHRHSLRFREVLICRRVLQHLSLIHLFLRCMASSLLRLSGAGAVLRC